PGLSLAKEAPLGPEIPIDTVVILMLENRSFDHLLGALAAAGQPDADVAPAGATNPDGNGNPVAWHRDTDLCFGDTGHEWSPSWEEYDGGKNDGFVRANESHAGAADGGRAMTYYAQDDLPF